MIPFPIPQHKPRTQSVDRQHFVFSFILHSCCSYLISHTECAVENYDQPGEWNVYLVTGFVYLNFCLHSCLSYAYSSHVLAHHGVSCRILSSQPGRLSVATLPFESDNCLGKVNTDIYVCIYLLCILYIDLYICL